MTAKKQTSRVRTAILISGRGSNMKSLVEAARAKDYPAEIAIVVSNRPDAAGIAWASDNGVPVAVVDHKAFEVRKAFEAAVQVVLEKAHVELVALAGFMRILTPVFVERWAGRMINIHPSLLPAFKGLDTHARAIEAGVAKSGCTVHFVTPDMDAGPVILQSEVPVLEGDTADTLSARVLVAEHRAYPEALAMVASGRVRYKSN